MNRKDYIFVKSTEKIMSKIYYKDIVIIMASRDYCRIITDKKVYVVHFTMNAILQALPLDMFSRCNRSTIVNVDKIESIEKSILNIGNSAIELSWQYREDLLKKINFISKAGSVQT